MVCCADIIMPMRNLTSLLALAALVVVSSSWRSEPAAWTVAVQRVASPAGPNSSEPQIVDSGRGRILSWVGARRYDVTSEILRAYGIGLVARRDRRIRKRLVPELRGRPVGHAPERWNSSHSGCSSSTRSWKRNLRLSGRTRRTTARHGRLRFMPHNDGTKTQHGFASLVEMPGNTLGVVWLDGRNSPFDFDKPDTGTMTLRYAAYDSSFKQNTDTRSTTRCANAVPRRR